MLNLHSPIGQLTTGVAAAGAFYLFRKWLSGSVCKDVVDLSGKTVIVTGGNTGIGYATAKLLARMGAHMIVACRDEKRGDEAVKSLKKETKSEKIESMLLDLSSLKSVQTFCENFKKKNIPLHILINNAGVYNTVIRKTKDGFESTFGTNHLGHFLLTKLLIEKLKETKGRIVNVSSDGHTMGDVDLDDVNWEKKPYHHFKAYCASKTANILFTVELERRFSEFGVQSYSVHPGAGELFNFDCFKCKVLTSLARDASPIMSLLVKVLFTIFGKSLDQGAQSPIYAAISPRLEGMNQFAKNIQLSKGKGGSYIFECNVSKAAPYATDPERAKKLWLLSEEMIASQLK